MKSGLFKRISPSPAQAVAFEKAKKMSRSRKLSCLARIAPEAVSILTNALASVECPLPLVVQTVSVTELGKLSPALLLIDVDRLDVDPLETLRMLRFVLPNCMIGVYTKSVEQDWALACHMAGANCLLYKGSETSELAAGIRQAMQCGCFTDAHFTPRARVAQ